MTHRHRLEDLLLPLDDQDRPQSSSASRVTRVSCSSALLDGLPASRDHQRMDPTVRELVLLALLSGVRP